MLILFLLVGLSSLTYAQGRHRAKKNGLETNKKVEPRKQRSHFEKQPKDKKIAFNGSRYRKSSEYTLDGNGFSIARPGKKKYKKAIADIKTPKKRYQKRIGRSVYASR